METYLTTWYNEEEDETLYCQRVINGYKLGDKIMEVFEY